MDSTFQPVKFGRYQLQERIAIGGMAEIFLAKVSGAMGFEKTVVIKRILPQYGEDPDFLRMFITEAKLVCYLDHPNIVQVQELGEVNRHYYIAMEYVNGVDGRQLWRNLARRKQRLPGVLSLYVVSEFLKGLDYAHRAVGPDGNLLGVVHRDVSPSNVLISYRGDVKIVDFGIALVEHESKTKAGVLKGKYGYMSPEQVQGNKVDHRSDIFSAGIVLAELLLGRRLFMGRNDFETLDNVMNVRLDVLDRSEKALPPDVVQIVRKALTRDYKTRYQSAREFHDDIAELLFKQGERISAETLAAFVAQHVVPFHKGGSKSDTSGSGHSPAPNIRSPVLPGSIVPKDHDLTPPPFSAYEEQVPTVSVDDHAPTVEAPVVPGESVSLLQPPDGSAPEITSDPRFGTMAMYEAEHNDQQEIPLAEVPKPQAVTPGPPVSVDSHPSIKVHPDAASDDMELDLDDEVEDEVAAAAAKAVPGRKRPSALVQKVLPSAQQPGEKGQPNFTGQLAARTMAKVLFRFCVVREDGLLSLSGPEPSGEQQETLAWLNGLKERLSPAWEATVANSSTGRTCELHFTKGKPDLATADRSELALVAYLVCSGTLAKAKVDMAVRANPQRRLIAALLAAGLLAPLQVSRHVSAFVLDNILATFSWNEGSFAFYRGKECTGEAFMIDLGAEELLVKGISTIPESFLDVYLGRLAKRRVAPNRKPARSIKVFKPDDVLLSVYRSLGAGLTVHETLARNLTIGDRRRIKQALYLLIECDLALLQ